MRGRGSRSTARTRCSTGIRSSLRRSRRFLAAAALVVLTQITVAMTTRMTTIVANTAPPGPAVAHYDTRLGRYLLDGPRLSSEERPRDRDSVRLLLWRARDGVVGLGRFQTCNVLIHVKKWARSL